MKVAALRRMKAQPSRETLRSARLVRRLRVARSALQEQNRRLDQIEQSARVGLWDLDFTSGAIKASPHWREMFGLQLPVALDLDGLMERIEVADRPSFSRCLAAAQTGEGGLAAECRIRLPTGETRWVAWHGQIEFGASGQPLHLRGVSQDVTERKMEQQLSLQRQKELTHLSRVSMLGGLSGAIAHELNQPLTAILTNADAGLRFLAQGEAGVAEVREILDDIAIQGRRAGEIIRRLRVLMRPGVGPHNVLDLNDLLLETLGLMSHELLLRHITVKSALEPTLPCVKADRVQLQQVVINLINNACQAMQHLPAGQGQVTVRTAHVPGQGVRVSIVDKGPGIPDEILGKVFDSFFTTKPNGMGLGLPVCRAIMFAHDGRLWAESSDGGATFHFSLPSATAESS
jgi:PAS domain S-box-containing protein